MWILDDFLRLMKEGAGLCKADESLGFELELLRWLMVGCDLS